MQQRWLNETGSSLTSIFIMLFLLGFMGVAVTNMVSTDSSLTTNDLKYTQALQAGSGGIQQATYKLNQGILPNISNQTFGGGTFSTTTNAAMQSVTVTSTFGGSKNVQSLSIPFSQQCVSMDVTSADIQGARLKDIDLVKTCNTKATLTQMKVEWNWAACVTNAACTGTTGTANPNPDPDVGKQTVCHVPPGNPGNQHSITVGRASVDAHRAHSDTMASCPAGFNSTALVCEGYDAQVESCGPADLGARVDRIRVNGTTVADEISAASGTVINLTSTNLTTANAYTIDEIRFNQNPPEGAWFAVTAYFADGSSIRKPFKFSPNGAVSYTSTIPDYSTTGGVVTVEPNKPVRVDVIGTYMKCSSNNDNILVSVDLSTNNVISALFNNQKVSGGEFYTTNTAASTAYKIRARSSGQSSCGYFNSMYDSSNATQVKLLVNGTQAPPLQGYGGAQPVRAFLAPYLTAQGLAILNANQVMMMFEMGVNASTSPTLADFQDLVVVFTIN